MNSEEFFEELNRRHMNVDDFFFMHDIWNIMKYEEKEMVLKKLFKRRNKRND